MLRHFERQRLDLISRSGCETRRLPSTPGAYSPPVRCTETAALIGRSSRTSCRSMCVTYPRSLSTWYSLRIDACDSPAVDLDVEDRVQSGRARQGAPKLRLLDV